LESKKVGFWGFYEGLNIVDWSAPGKVW